MIEGHTLEHITEALTAAGIAEPNTMLAEVGDKLAEDARTPADAMRGWAMNATREVYRRALTVGDYGAALRAIKMLLQITEE